MKICENIQEVRKHLATYGQHGHSIALVPTMGNLHRAHLSLIDIAKQNADKVVASIFVNPKQFGPTEDFATYPRTFEADCQKLAACGVDLLFKPETDEMYPAAFSNQLKIDLVPLSQDLCGQSRPQFFPGVMFVVSKLFNIIQPQFAVFGEKDFQQLMIIKQMVDILNYPIQIISAPLVREPDGLAMSSRNGYLSVKERQIAPLFYQTLCDIRDGIIGGETAFEPLLNKAFEKLKANGFVTDYIELRAKKDLSKLTDENSKQSLVILGAAYLGKTRLIDNLFW